MMNDSNDPDQISSRPISATKDIPPNGGVAREMGPLISQKWRLRLMNYYNLARMIFMGI